MTTIYTIGHSNHEPGAFLKLLHQKGIQILVDVRSSPYSRYVPHANRETLARTLHAGGITYRWLGDRLGGKPNGIAADYDKLRASPVFREGIADLLSLAEEGCTTIMCAEGDHRQCHRYRLITPALLDQGIHVLHIQPDGTVIDEEEEPRQLALL